MEPGQQLQPGTLINGVPVGSPPLKQARTRPRMKIRRPILIIRLLILAVIVVVGVGTTIYNRIAGPHVDTFYTVSEADYKAFDPSTSQDPPSETSSFPSGTSNIALYYDVEGANSGSTAVTVDLDRGSSKGDLIASFDPATADHDYLKEVETLPLSTPLPSGSYRLVLSINGKVAQSHVFTVR